MSGDVFKRPLNYPGFFIVFEGPDGAGTTTQAAPLINWIKGANKYHDVLDTHEPWKSVAINEVLTQDSDPNAQKDLMTRLFTEMRQDHTVRLISPSLANGIIVLSDRYTMSTCAYQQAQGEGLPKIVGMHRARNILVPNITYLIDAPVDVCMARIGHREGDREKFEQQEFLERVRENYLDLAESAKRRKCGGLLGDVVVIDGRPSIDDVTAEIVSDFEPRYRGWVENVRDYEDSSGEQLALELWGPDNSKANSGPVRES